MALAEGRPRETRTPYGTGFTRRRQSPSGERCGSCCATAAKLRSTSEIASSLRNFSYPLRRAVLKQTKSIKRELFRANDFPNGTRARAQGQDKMPEPLTCLWCEQVFVPRTSGGKPQRFCRPDHRDLFHAAARRWAENAVTAGLLSPTELRRRSEMAHGNMHVAPMWGAGCAATPVAPDASAFVAPSNRTTATICDGMAEWVSR